MFTDNRKYKKMKEKKKDEKDIKYLPKDVF